MSKKKRTTNGKTIYIHPQNERQILSVKPRKQSFSEFIVKTTVESIGGTFFYSEEHAQKNPEQ